MAKVYQCDRCKRIFEPRVLGYGEPYIARKNQNSDIDLCPECYDSLLAWLKTDDDCFCLTCKYRDTPTTKEPCKVCSHCWNDNYEGAEDEDSD